MAERRPARQNAPQAARADAARERALPDESDHIIQDLRAKLAGLEDKVRRLEAGRRAAPREDDLKLEFSVRRPGLVAPDQAAAHRAGLLPAVADQAGDPLDALTSTLERAIDGVHDAEVRASLAGCRDIARDLLRGLRGLGERSRMLDAPLRPAPKTVDVLGFFKALAMGEADRGRTGLSLYASPDAPKQFFVDEALFREIVLILMKEVRRVNGEDSLRITLRRGQETIVDLGVDKAVERLRVNLTGERPWDLPAGGEAQAYLRRALVESEEKGLDILYAERVVREHGGELAFHREDGQVVGFGLTLPCGP